MILKNILWKIFLKTQDVAFWFSLIWTTKTHRQAKNYHTHQKNKATPELLMIFTTCELSLTFITHHKSILFTYKLSPIENYFSSYYSTQNKIFFYLKKICFILKIFRFLVFLMNSQASASLAGNKLILVWT